MGSVGNCRVEEFQPFGGYHRRLESAHAKTNRPILAKREPGILPNMQATARRIGEALGHAPHSGMASIREVGDANASKEQQCPRYHKRSFAQILSRRARYCGDRQRQHDGDRNQNRPRARSGHHRRRQQEQGKPKRHAEHRAPIKQQGESSCVAEDVRGGKHGKRQQADQQDIGLGVPIGLEAGDPADMKLGVEAYAPVAGNELENTEQGADQSHCHDGRHDEPPLVSVQPGDGISAANGRNNGQQGGQRAARRKRDRAPGVLSSDQRQ